MRAKYEYRFSIEIPKEIEIEDQVFDYANEIGAELELLNIKVGMVRKTLFFLAGSNDKQIVKQMKERVQNGFVSLDS